MLEPTPDLLRKVLTLIFERATENDAGCWIYDSTEYPTISVDGKSARFSRVVYTLFVGPIPDGYEVDHECHNRDLTCTAGTACIHRRCLNPDHLRARTHADNVQSSRRTDRYPYRRQPPRRVQGPARVRLSRITPPRRTRQPGAAWIATRDLARILGLSGSTAAIRLGQQINRELRVRATEPREMPDGSRARGYFVDDILPLLPLDAPLDSYTLNV